MYFINNESCIFQYRLLDQHKLCVDSCRLSKILASLASGMQPTDGEIISSTQSDNTQQHQTKYPQNVFWIQYFMIEIVPDVFPAENSSPESTSSQQDRLLLFVSNLAVLANWFSTPTCELSIFRSVESDVIR